MLKTSLGRGRLASKVATTAVAAFAAALILAPTPALANNETTWELEGNTLVLDASEQGPCPGHVVTGSQEDSKIEILGGTHTITLNNCTVNPNDSWNPFDALESGIDIEGNSNVTLVVTGNNTVEATGSHPAIWIEDGSSLTIIGDGTLTANGSGNGAGIGVDPGATLTIGQHVGPFPAPVTVNANGGSTGGALGAAGIGGDNNDDFGNVIINSGIVNAVGGGSAAGIGSGHGGTAWAATGNITINGGWVHATGGDGAAGVATGAGLGCGENVNYGGTISINGGVVHAIGGDENQASIGGGGSGIGDRNNGTFIANGNAVIVAPWGIGDTSRQADWKCILLAGETVDYDATTGDVTFTGGTPQVVGNVEADYNITVNSPASLRVTDGSANNGNPATLTMKSGTTLTNNNKASDPGIAGIALMPGSTLVLEDGTSQCQGDGVMIATSAEGTGYARGKVQLPLSDDMVSVKPTSYVYDGTEKTPDVTVSFPKWSFSQTFTQGSEYTVSYENNTNMGTATATATSAGGNLLNRNGVASTGSATFEITEGDFVVSTVSRRYIQVGEEHLLDKLPKTPTFGANNPPNVEGGTFAWFSDSDCNTPLTDTFVQNESEGAQITVYWKYTQTGNPNVTASKTGTTTLIMTKEEPPAVQVDGVNDDIVKNATYGDSLYKPTIQISLDGGNNWINPLSEITYSVTSETPAGSGDVVTVNEKTGEIQFVGAGEATVLAEIHAYTDPNATDQDKGNTYGPAFVTITIHVAPKEVSVEPSSVKATDRAYNGTSKVEVTAELVERETVGDDLANGLIGVSAKGTAAQPAVGSNIPVTVTYTLTGDKADDYALTNAPATAVNISKAQAGTDTLQGKTGELTISNCAAATYVYDLNKIVPDTKQVEGGMLAPGWIEFANPKVSISDNRYFTAADIRIDNVTHTLYLTVNDVESHEVGQLGTITLDMISPNFEGMTGTINVMREDMEIHTITATAGEGGTISPSGTVEVVDAHDQVFTFTPDEGYKMSQVLVDGKAVEATDSYTFTGVTENHTIEVTFEKTDPTTPAHEHVWSDWKHDGDNHWKECTECGAIAEKGEHTYGDWVDLNRTDDQGRNLWEHTCSVCGYVQYGTTGGDSTDVTPIDGEGIPSAGDPTSLAPIAIAGAAGISALLARRRL